ncbi:four helix bundle protein [Desulfitobacterium hafniense]|uniref:four helix bundle protein n=1 Tax=Desulfitobacterium hafniense TaxID=49338 RepID=UPI00037C336F|nr:four helix bundle protein [Desulfitobacterium hafniense]
MKYYKDLKVWQKAMDLTVEVYRLVKLLPREELFALSSQMRRAAVSIASNIAEKQGRNSAKEFLQFIAIAKGSNSELETQLLICVRVGYMEEQTIQVALSLITEIAKMLSSLSRTLATRNLQLEAQVNGVNDQ